MFTTFRAQINPKQIPFCSPLKNILAWKSHKIHPKEDEHSDRYGFSLKKKQKIAQ